MDITRFALYTALAIVTYLMLLQWQEDYPPVVDDGSTSSLEIPQLTNSDTPAVSDLPTALPTTLPPTSVDTNNTASGDTPVLTSTPVAVTNNTSRLISITTDTFDLRVDLNGGDIVYLALPLYLKQIDVPDDPFVMLDNVPGRNYVAQSGLIGPNGVDANGRAAYQSSSVSYEMNESDNSLDVDLVTTSNGVQVIKRFHFERDSYLIGLDYIVENNSGSEWQANAYGQIKRDSFEDPSSAGGMSRTYLGFVTTAEDDPYIEVEFDDIDDDGSSTVETPGGWVGFSQHYFVSAWIPNVESQNRFTTRKNGSNQYIGEFTSSAFNVASGETGSHGVQYYAGPKEQYVLEEISPNLELSIDYSFLWFIAAPIYWLLSNINSFVGNFGISIILLTVCVKAAFYKLSETQYRSMAGMRRLQPKMAQLKESYGDDKMKMQKATMDLYKKEKINPFGGCLPMLVQMPVFIALYWVLLESVELRHAPFFLWLTDLSVRDPFFILPLLMGATMYLQTSLSPAPADPMQAKMMKLMPIMMTVLFLWFPAGLVLYWLTNGALGILQQWFITRRIEAAYEAKKA
ncbi:MAG: membrane protein insertase YidC [Gammaproteobacteria bacterium]|jgi:YidC/Oxa1 family membrane protein insertase|nr:membrane protein insertase YidC [Gammaproteobacteria bacterium]MBT3861075.1 membrane protein insertase YidC [Gammaproteobacteria bacterium]MBT3987715.1 membrane protein insertase YidC [Gammaproteobacteria bacterium]MBT4255625.1 membrane protein insertase YidC [Gammaproteobacteria bacterium]MBT4582705.1 membrane protein insertase YidC [Gammaproteobacteria bacterium]